MKLWSGVVSGLTQTLKDLENVQPHVLPSAYEYRESILKEEKQVEMEETANFKREMLDPTREIVTWERKLAQ